MDKEDEKKKFKVRVLIQTEVTVEIEAEDEEEALDKASELRPDMGIDWNKAKENYEFEGSEIV